MKVMLVAEIIGDPSKNKIDKKFRYYDIFPNKFKKNPFLSNLFTVQCDGTECPVQKCATNFHKSYIWYSGYWADCTAKYLIFCSIETGILVEISGPYYGSESDSSCAKDSRWNELLNKNNEFGIGDNKFGGLSNFKVKTNYNSENKKNFQEKRPLVENVVGYFKRFGMFNNNFRHDKKTHPTFFYGIGQFVFYQTFLFPHVSYPPTLNENDYNEYID